MKLIGSVLAVLFVARLTAGIHGGEKSAMPLGKDFLIKVATANNAEIQLSKLAEEHSQSTQVKDYAKMVAKDHQAAGDKLAELLKSRKLAIVAGFESQTRDDIARLGKLNGVQFDHAFLHSMIKAHKNAISLFQNEVKNGREEDIRSFATNVLPDLRKHLSRAEELSKAGEK